MYIGRSIILVKLPSKQPMMDTIQLIAHNVNGLCSSEPYIRELLTKCDVLGISEHWLCGPQLNNLDNLSDDFLCEKKCHSELLNSPPLSGRGYGGVAIFYKKCLNASRIQNINSHSICGICLKRPGMKDTIILNIYMPASNRSVNDYLQEVTELEDIVHKYENNAHIIVIGDCNIQLDNRFGPRGYGKTSVRSDALYGLVKNCDLVAMDLQEGAVGPKFSFHRNLSKSWIDHVLVSSNLEYNSCGIMEEQNLNTSDHLPVFISFNLNMIIKKSNDCVYENRVPWFKATEDQLGLYSSKVDELIMDTVIHYANVEIESLNEVAIEDMCYKITSAMINAAEHEIPSSSPKRPNSNKYYWNQDLGDIAKNKKEIYKQWVQAGRPRDENSIIYKHHIEIKKKFRSKLREAKYKFMSKIELDIERNREIDQKQFWFLLNKKKRVNNNISMMMNASGETKSDQKDIEDIWFDHFSKLSKLSEDANFDEQFKKHVDHTIKQHSANPVTCETDSVLKDPITPAEIETISKNFKIGKAQDKKGLQYEHIKYAGHVMYTMLSILLNSIISLEYIPRDFKEGVIVPIFKGGKKDVLDVNSYRGITLQSSLCKLFEAILLKRSMECIKRCMKHSQLQGACNKGMSSIMSSFALHEAVSNNIENGNCSYVLYFDNEKAFDLAWINGLLYKMYTRGIRGKLWRLIKVSYEKCISCVRVNNKFTADFCVEQGVKQGGILSMLLYTCYINDLLLEITDSGLSYCYNDMDLGCICYADDLAILTIHIAFVRLLLQLTWDHSCRWRFRLNAKKCAIVSYGSSIDEDYAFKLGESDVSVKNEYVHLGINNMSGSKIDMNEILDSIGRAKRALFGTIGSGLSSCILSPASISKVYHSVSLPKMITGAEVRYFSKNELDAYDSCHIEVAKRIQNLPTNCPNIAALSSLGWHDILYYVELAKLMFVFRLLSLSADSIYRRIFVLRFYFISSNMVYSVFSPVAMIIKILKKYHMYDQVVFNLENGTLPSKAEWKKYCLSRMNTFHLPRWRLVLKLYPRLNIFRIVCVHYEQCIWWKIAKLCPMLKYKCVTMMKMLTCSNSLNANVYRGRGNEELCARCGQLETEYHLVIECNDYQVERRELFMMIENSLDLQDAAIWNNLSLYMKFLTLLGLDFPFDKGKLLELYKHSCNFVHKIYWQRIKN